jgi:ABC-2 type transport system permease protein
VTRIKTLVNRELLDLARNWMTLVPVILVTILALGLPFLVAVAIPRLTGHPLANDSDLAWVSSAAGTRDGLSGEGQVQLFLFQQFLLLFLIIPVTGAMAIAAHSIVGEKQARTLEPLLASPVTTLELLVAKVLAALFPTAAIAAAGLVVYLGGIGWLAEAGVARSMASLRTVVLVALVGPAAALVSLQLTMVVSSRVNDARTAQQFGVLLILPLSALLVAQFIGRMWLSASALAAVAAGLFALWLILVGVSVALFDRETILTRWR